MKKHIIMIIAAAIAFVLLLSACGKTAEKSSETESSDKITGKYTAEIIIKDYGTIEIEMDADKAPITVANFVKLVDSGFYNGLTFHRIMSGFMMQGGDPNGNGTGGSDTKIKGEFAKNKVDNPQSHVRGAVSMARANDMNSASSQFFIVHADSTFLDGSYACFGYVTAGMDVVDAVCENARPYDNNGSIRPAEQPVIESIKILTRG